MRKKLSARDIELCDDHRSGLTDAYFTAHENTVTECGASYLQGFEARSSAPISCFLEGAEVGIAFLPVEVMVSGFDLEKRGRIND